MKKLLLFAAMLGFAVACGGGEKKEEPKNEEATVVATAETEATECEEQCDCNAEATVEADKAAGTAEVKKEPVQLEVPATAVTPNTKKETTLTVKDAPVKEGPKVNTTLVKVAK